MSQHSTEKSYRISIFLWFLGNLMQHNALRSNLIFQKCHKSWKPKHQSSTSVITSHKRKCLFSYFYNSNFWSPLGRQIRYFPFFCHWQNNTSFLTSTFHSQDPLAYCGCCENQICTMCNVHIGKVPKLAHWTVFASKPFTCM